jgi:hypothetical protein
VRQDQPGHAKHEPAPAQIRAGKCPRLTAARNAEWSDNRARRSPLQRIQNHAFDMRVNVERGRSQESDQRLIIFASEIDRESRRR